MKRNLQTLRAVGMLALMGGALYAVAGCGTDTTGTAVINPTDTAIPAGQRLYVSNQIGVGSANVLRFDQVLSQATGTILQPGATFSNLTTATGVSVDFSGNLLAGDAGADLVDVYTAGFAAAGTVSVPNLTLAAVGTTGGVFDSSHAFFYATSGAQIQQFSSAGTPISALTDAELPNPTVLAFDDVHSIANGSTGVMFAAGTNGAAGDLEIIDLPQTLVGTGDISGNSGVTHITNISGVSLKTPTGIAYDNQHLQLWIADPQATDGLGNTGFVFRLDNADNIKPGANAIGAAFQIAATSVAVDFSSGFATLMTNNSPAQASTVEIFPFATNISTSTGKFLAAQIGVPNTVILSGVTNVISITDDSVH